VYLAALGEPGDNTLAYKDIRVKHLKTLVNVNSAALSNILTRRPYGAKNYIIRATEQGRNY